MRFAGAHGSRQSAAIAYYVLLSLFPLMLVTASIAGLVLKDEGLRADLVQSLADALPVTEAGASDLDSALRGVGASAAGVGLASLVALVWSASGMMSAIRGGLDDIAQIDQRRPFVRGKLVDLLMLAAASLLLAAAAGLSVATRVAQEWLVDLTGQSGVLFEAARIAVPIAIGTGVLIVLLRWVPTAAPRTRDIWPAALVGATALWALSVGFAVFVQHFGRYNVVYGSLAAVVIFLIFIYLAANVVLMTGALATEWRAVLADRPGSEPGPGLGAQVLSFLRGLVVPSNRPP